MFKQKWLAILGVAVLVASVIFSFSAIPSGAAGLTAVPQSQNNHARPPIKYFQVAKPVGRGNPGRGPGGSSVVYAPANIQQAYDFGNLASNGGANESIAIVDAYGDSNLSSDVAAFDSQFGIPAAEIQYYYPDGTPNSTNKNWALETALDVEWAHANAPGATIDIVVVPDSSLQSLLDGVNAAINLDPTAISMSWGAPETSIGSYMTAFEDAFQSAASKNIILLGASGDSGATDGTSQLTTDYPASSPEVIGVGGTSLYLNSSGGYGSETGWSSSGGGYSTIYSEPGYQSTAEITDPTGMRGVPDVAFDANPYTGVYVYSNGSWYAVGGTSVGAPNWAAIEADYASANSGKQLKNTVLYDLYGTSSYGSDLHDITSGNNGYYNAGTGWDAVTGIGSPNVAALIGSSGSSGSSSSAPSAPQNLIADAGNGQVTLTWSAPSSDGGSAITNYKIYRGTSSGGESYLTTIGNTTTYADSAVNAGTTYYYEVTAVNDIGESGPSNEASASPTSSSTATSVSVTGISYATSGGKNHNNNLSITVSLVDNLGNPVANASVSISVDLNGSAYTAGTGTTGSNGEVTFTINHAPSGTYQTTVTNVSAGSLYWNPAASGNTSSLYTKN